MIRIYRLDDLLILEYTIDHGPNWVRDKLSEDGEVTLRKTFRFGAIDVFDDQYNGRDTVIEGGEDLDPFDHESVRFILGRLVDNYYKIDKGKLTYDHDVFLHNSIKVETKLFVSHRNISIFAKLERFIQDNIFVGGEATSAIPESVMWDLIQKFPNTRQKDLYESSVITSIIRDYVDNVPDYRVKYENYLNKRRTVEPSDLGPLLKDNEAHKFQLLLNKLNVLLNQQTGYSENQWQEEILEIITLIYPKYIYAFKNVQLKRKNQTDLFIDILLIDSGGYADIIEIKKPFESVIVTQTTYRNNHIPFRELTGTIMQIEKYIYHLNRWGMDGEKLLSKKLSGLPDGFEVKLTNPGGLVIMGRDNNLTLDQMRDFEVVKRKYKNIIDILTYDELIRRLTFMINMWSQKTS